MFCSGVGFNFLVVAGHHLFLTLICLIKLNYTEVQRPDFRPSQGPQNASELRQCTKQWEPQQ